MTFVLPSLAEAIFGLCWIALFGFLGSWLGKGLWLRSKKSGQRGQ